MSIHLKYTYKLIYIPVVFQVSFKRDNETKQHKLGKGRRTTHRTSKPHIYSRTRKSVLSIFLKFYRSVSSLELSRGIYAYEYRMSKRGKLHGTMCYHHSHKNTLGILISLGEKIDYDTTNQCCIINSCYLHTGVTGMRNAHKARKTRIKIINTVIKTYYYAQVLSLEQFEYF